MVLPGGFSPLNAIREVGDTFLPNDVNYDVFSQRGKQTTNSLPIGSTYYDSGTGAIGTYDPQTGQWDRGAANESNPASETTAVLGRSTGGGGSGTSGYSSSDLALLDNQINSANSALARLLGQRDIGYYNIDQSVNDARNRLDSQKAVAERDYNTGKLQETQDYTNSRSGVRADAGRQFSALQRLLGSMGSGRSSAAQILAPFAVGREAATRFGQVQDTFGRNQAQRDTVWGDTMRGYDENVAGLEQDRLAKRRELESGILQQEMGLRDTLGQLTATRTANAGGDVMGAIAPQQSRIQAILDQIDQLGRVEPIQARSNVAYSTPNVSQYNYSQFDAPTIDQNAPGAGDYVSPLTAILKRRDQKLA